MAVHKIKSPNFNFAAFVERGWFCVFGDYEMGDIALLRETFGANNACTGRAEIFEVTNISHSIVRFTYIPAE